MRALRFALTLLLACLVLCSGAALAASSVQRDLPPGLQIPPAAQPGPTFDVDRATAAYLALLTPEQGAMSEAYFEGGYWIQLWSVLYAVASMVVLMATGASRRMRDLAERVTRRPLLSVALY